MPPPGWTWTCLMERALAAAREAMRAGDVPVGALVVSPAGDILSCIGNRVEQDGDPTAHAEVLALRLACGRQGSPRLPGDVLVVTLEPCLMCVGAMAHARISGVVFGAYDVRAGALSSQTDHVDLPLGGCSMWHLGGVLADPCAAVLRRFFQKRR